MIKGSENLATQKIDYAVSLSGGGLLSVSQLGMLDVIESKAGKPSIYTGTSGGSIVAGLLGAGISSKEILENFKKLSKKALHPNFWHVIKGIFKKYSYVDGFIDGKLFEGSIDQLTNYTRLAQMAKKIGIVTTDINSGQEVIFTNVNYKTDFDEDKIRSKNWRLFPNSYERLAHVIHASCSVPGIFVPTMIAGTKLVDGGIVDNLPADVAYALGAKKVISIDLGYAGQAETKGLYDILDMSLQILTRRNVEDNKGEYGLYLDPKIYDVGFLCTSRIEEVYQRGRAFATNNMEQILSYLKS